MDILYDAEYYKICWPHVTVLLVTVRLFVNVYFVFANQKSKHNNRKQIVTISTVLSIK